VGQPKLTVRIYKLNVPSDVVRTHLLGKGFCEIPCRADVYRLFIRTRPYSPKWVPFLQELTDQELKVQDVETSFVLLRHSVTGLYAVTGGNGNHAIQELVDPGFGLDAAARLIGPNDVKAVRHKSLAGGIDQVETVYKGQHSVSLEPFDYVHVRAMRYVLGTTEANELAKQLGLASSNNRLVRVEGRYSFSVRKGLTIDEFEAMIERIDTLLQKQALIPMMKGCIEVDKKHAKELDQLLVQEIAGQYQAYLRDPELISSSPEISFSYVDARQFVASASYKISAEGHSKEVDLLDVDALFHLLREWEYDKIHPKRFLSIRVEGLDDDGNRTFETSLSKLVSAELLHEGNTYFRADGRWFLATASFVQNLELRLREFLLLDDGFVLPSWPVADGKPVHEDHYLTSDRFGDPHYYVLHRKHVIITYGNDRAEVCDLLDRRSGHTTFIFVKRGVAGPVRELARQAYDSVYLLIRDSTFRQRAQEKIDELGGGWSLSTLTPGQIDVVLAVVDILRGRSAKPLLERMTTLAKMELVYALEQLRGLGVRSARVYEIPGAWS